MSVHVNLGFDLYVAINFFYTTKSALLVLVKTQDTQYSLFLFCVSAFLDCLSFWPHPHNFNRLLSGMKGCTRSF